jgi:two-component system chemotaxis response regulator CheY
MVRKVIVVDDSSLIRQQVGRALRLANFSVIDAADGVEALQKLADHPDTGLAICDVNMPRMGGIEFLEELQTRAARPQIVMLTTEGQPDLIVRAKALGAKAWILKPFKPEQIVAVATKLLTPAA